MPRERQPGSRRFLASGHPLQERKDRLASRSGEGREYHTAAAGPSVSLRPASLSGGALPGASAGVLEETRDLEEQSADKIILTMFAHPPAQRD